MVVTPHVPAAAFLLDAHDMLCFNRYRNLQTDERKFRALFGCSTEACQDLWKITFGYQKVGTQPKHLLWALLQLKVYATEDVLAALIGCDRKTFRKWVWPMIRAIRKAAPAVVSLCCFSQQLFVYCVAVFLVSPVCMLLFFRLFLITGTRLVSSEALGPRRASCRLTAQIVQCMR